MLPTRAVDKRARELNQEYILKARNTDRQYCGTPPGTTGPVETKLARLGEVKRVVVEKQRPQPKKNLGKPEKGRPSEQGPGQGTPEARPIQERLKR